MKVVINYVRHLELTVNQLILLVSVYLVAIINIPFLTKMFVAITELQTFSYSFLLSVPVYLIALMVIFLSLFSINLILKPALFTLVLISAMLFYAGLTYGIAFDYGMLQNTVETNGAEAKSYLNFYAVCFVVIFGVLPVLFIGFIKIKQQSALRELLQRFKLIGVASLVIIIISALFYSNYASIGRNNRDLLGYVVPFKFIDASYKYIRNQYIRPPIAFQVLDTKPWLSTEGNKVKVTVVVVGETARSQSFSLNGYERNTNAYTSALGVVSFTNMFSCGTATAVSVPCMFSKLDKKSFDKRLALSQQNVLDIVNLAGADVLWIDNNSSCKGVCIRVKTIHIDTNKSNPLCDGEYCFDEALLAPMKDKLSNLTSKHTLIVLHMIGSHGPTYYRRYPQSQSLFLPDCQRSDIQNCSTEELVNTYDNTIAYTDYVLAEIINELKQISEQQLVDTAMLYVSDHGESLGEKGVYLHGLPYAFAPSEQIQIPMLYWQSNADTNIDINCLTASTDNSYSHDNIFASVLSLMAVNSSQYDAQKDIFYHCKNKSNFAVVAIGV